MGLKKSIIILIPICIRNIQIISTLVAFGKSGVEFYELGVRTPKEMARRQTGIPQSRSSSVWLWGLEFSDFGFDVTLLTGN